MRIAIVNDMLMAVEAVRRVVAAAPDHSVAWVAVDGADAVARCAVDRPDLILMDLVMPRMDGVEATRQIMANTPCPIVVVTASVEDNCARAFQAMGAGALDAVNTPVFDTPNSSTGAAALLGKIETIRRLTGSSDTSLIRRHAADSGGTVADESGPLVVIGASAGGPSAIARVLLQIPPGFAAPIIIVQHVDQQFAPGLADWLARQTHLPVELAQEGHKPLPRKVLLAGTDKHLVMNRFGRLSYTPHPRDASYRPSIDLLFRTVAQFWNGPVIGVLLTGMGRDGAAGLLALKEKGHVTLAQDRATSAVYGMPKAAADLHAASEILPLYQIGSRITALIPGNIRNAHG